MPDTIDSYQKFIETFKIDRKELYLFGVRETILPSIDKIEENWEALKERIYNNGVVSIRGYGREAKGTDLYLGLYKHLFNNESVKKDPTNNFRPQKIISQLTGYNRNVNLFNYQVSHIFGKTKNIFLFEAPWNIALVPKIIDPFTGHETKGQWPEEYQELFLSHVKGVYSKFIDGYNQLISSSQITDGILEYINFLKETKGLTREIIQFEKDVILEFTPIGFINKKDEEIKQLVGRTSLVEVKSINKKIEFNSNEEIYNILLKLKHEKNRSWVQLRKGCLDLLGLPVRFTTQPMKSTSRAFARECQRRTGLSFNELLEIIEEHQLGT